MCGIVGYTGPQAALPVLMDGLAALEYRGYDSAGVALVDAGAVHVRKRAGRLATLGGCLAAEDWPATTGIAHTRWATHGGPHDHNAHPHTDCGGSLAVVHNGIIENHAALRVALVEGGCRFRSDTDSEVLAHLVARELGGTPPDGPDALAAAVRRALRRVEGAFALGVVSAALPGVVVGARRAAPLLVGRADGATVLASDVAGMVALTSDVEALDDDQVALLTPEGVEVSDLDGAPAHGRAFTVDWQVDQASRGAYAHYMLKEIHEQPTALRATLADRVTQDGRLTLDVEQRLGGADITNVLIIGCGTSAHAGMSARGALEQWGGVPVAVELASEFRYREPVVTPGTLVVAISQSGETADTLAAVAHAQERGARVLALTNTVGSTLTRDADLVLYTRAGPEVGVAATKTFTTQVAALDVLALWLAQVRGCADRQVVADGLRDLQQAPDLVERAIRMVDAEVRELADELAAARYIMLIGRHLDLPVALEGALKLKEISYIHADGYAAGEMKHGPIALIEPGGPVVALATARATRDKLVSNMAEVRARGAHVIAVAGESDVDIKEHADRVLFIPDTNGLWSPVVSVVPLQLLSYRLAVALGHDVDKPRNLAKTVTVE